MERNSSNIENLNSDIGLSDRKWILSKKIAQELQKYVRGNPPCLIPTLSSVAHQLRVSTHDIYYVLSDHKDCISSLVSTNRLTCILDFISMFHSVMKKSLVACQRQYLVSHVILDPFPASHSPYIIRIVFPRPPDDSGFYFLIQEL